MKKILLLVVTALMAGHIFAQEVQNAEAKNAGNAAWKAKNYTEAFAQWDAYLKANNYADDGVSLWIHAWGSSSSDKDVLLTHVGDGIYVADLGAYYPKVLFARGESGMTTMNWNKIYNQTVDLDVPSNNGVYTSNLFTLNSGEWNNAKGTWSTY